MDALILNHTIMVALHSLRMNPLTQNHNLSYEDGIYLDAVVEVQRGSKLKVEVCKETGTYRCDRVVNKKYPHAYGFVPSTLAEDGDCLDVFIVSEESLPPGLTFRVKVLGGIEMMDTEEGVLVPDNKLVATVVGEDIKVNMENIRDFLATYKSGTVVSKDLMTIDEVVTTINKSIDTL